MKKITAFAISSGLVLAGLFTTVQAQDLAYSPEVLKNNPVHLMAITNPGAAPATPALRVSSRIERDFEKTYRDAKNVTWYHNGRGYLARFEWNGTKAHAAYARDGYWFYDVRFGTAKNLPTAAQALLQSNYKDYTIGTATEVIIRNENVWVVNLENATQLVVVRIMNNHLDELVRYNTQLQTRNNKRLVF